MQEKMGVLNFFLVEHGPPSKVKRRVRGSSLIKVRNFQMPYFVIMFEGVVRNCFKRSKGVPEKQECY